MSKIGNLMKLQEHRRIGNTTFMVAGIAFNRPAAFIFANRAHARDAMDSLIRQQEIPLGFVNRAENRVGKVFFLTIDHLSEENYGKLWGMPIQIDHFALRLIVEEEQKRLIKLLEEARNGTK